METLRYALVCFELVGGDICGVIPGTAFSAVERSAQKLKAAGSDWLRRQHDDGDPPAQDLVEPQLRRAAVTLQLALPSKKGPYPLTTPTTLQVAAVSGRLADTGAWQCYLPWLDVSFFYYQPEQWAGLVAHFTRQRLEGRPPEEVAPFLQPGRVWLEELSLRITPTPRPAAKALTAAQRRLAQVAEPLPAARSAQRLFPETPWERAGEVEQVMAYWRGTRSHLLLVGAPGVGKSVVLLDAIRKVHQATRGQPEAPSFWRSSARRLLARARYLGEWQELCDQLADDLETVRGVLWLSDLSELLTTGGEGAEDSMAAYWLPALQQGRFHLLGELGEREWAAMRRRLPGFVELFRVVHLAELDAAATGRVIQQLGQYAEQHLALTPTPRALNLSYRLLARHVRYDSFPGKAARFLTAAVRRARAEHRTVLDEAAVLQEFTRLTGFPEIMLRDEWPLPVVELQAFFSSRVIGQPEVVDALSALVATFKAGLNDPARPIATLLFTGPTGVGKTAAALALAEYFFGAGAQRSPMFRLDMSEFQFPHQIHRLLGDERQPSKLVQHVRDRPFSVILFDEIEKADPLIFDALLTTLDEGLLTDARGRTTDFRGSVIILTTNLGARYGSAPGFIGSDPATGDHDIRRHFRPEFFNRLDRVVRFQALDRAAVAAIAARELQALSQRQGFSKRGLSLQFAPSCVDHIAAVGYHPRYGARPLQRAIERDVVAPLARLLLQHHWRDRQLHLAMADSGLQIDV